MLGARELTYTDDRGEKVTEYVGLGVVALPKRKIGDRPLTGVDRRDIRTRAIYLLREAGMSNEDIALAVGYSHRSIRRKVRTIERALMFARMRANGRV